MLCTLLTVIKIPNDIEYQTDPTGKRAIDDWEELLATMNLLLEQSPGWLYNTEGQKGLVGFPFNAILVSGVHAKEESKPWRC